MQEKSFPAGPVLSLAIPLVTASHWKQPVEGRSLSSAQPLPGPDYGNFVEFAAEQVPWMIDNHERLTVPVGNKIRVFRGKGPDLVIDRDVMDRQIHEEKGLVLKRRSEVQSDEEIVEVVRHKGQRLPRRPGLPRQTTSLDDIGGAYRRGGGEDRRNGQDDRRMTRYKKDRGRDGSDSEGSVPPRNRNREVAKYRGGGKSKSDNDQKAAERQVKDRAAGASSSASSSDLGSTTGDEKKCKKMSRKKWITAGLAGVATIHAVSSVYTSVEKHDKRIEEVFAGQMSPDEAHKKQQQARWQDAASIAIAALGIKGALSEWHEVQEQQHEHRELLESREERHRKRLERQRRQKARDQNGYYKGHDGNWYFDGDEGKVGRQGQHGSSRSGRNGSRQSSQDDYSRDRSQKNRKPAAMQAIEDY